MKKSSLSKILGIATFALASAAQAAPIYTQSAQGNYLNNQLFGSNWSTFTNMMTNQHSITQHADFTGSLGNAVWVDQEYGNTLSGAEIANLQNFYNSGNTEALVILDSNWNDNNYLSSADNNVFAQNIVDWLADSSTKKMVLIGENDLWTSWNDSIMQVVGGSHINGCDRSYASVTSSHTLTSGVGSVRNLCGSHGISSMGNPDILFSNNFAAVYSSNVNVSEPSTIALLGLGMIGLGAVRRKKSA